MFWNSEPRDDEKRMNAADAAGDYLEYCGTVLESIPGCDKVVELVSLIKQLIRVPSKRVLNLDVSRLREVVKIVAARWFAKTPSKFKAKRYAAAAVEIPCRIARLFVTHSEPPSGKVCNTEGSLSGRSNFEKRMTRGCRQIRRTGFAGASEDKYEGLPTSTFRRGSRVVVRRWSSGRRVTDSPRYTGTRRRKSMDCNRTPVLPRFAFST